MNEFRVEFPTWQLFSYSTLARAAMNPERGRLSAFETMSIHSSSIPLRLGVLPALPYLLEEPFIY